MKNRIGGWLDRVPEWAFPGLVMFAVSVFAYYIGSVIFDDRLPTHVISSRLLTPYVQPGEKLLTERRVFREALCVTTIYRYMKDSTGKRFDRPEDGLGSTEYPNGTGPLGEDTFIGQENVPLDMAPGPAEYYALPCHRCNWWDWVKPQCEPQRKTNFMVGSQISPTQRAVSPRSSP